jgi:hypothetical protein
MGKPAKFSTLTGPQKASYATLDAADQDMAADSFVFVKSGIAKKIVMADVVADMDGTASATGLTSTAGVLSVDIADLDAKTEPIAADSLMLCDSAATNALKEVTITQLTKAVNEIGAGTQSSSALTEVDGVLKVNPADNAVTVAADSIVYVTAAGVTKKDLISDFATAVAGTGLVSGTGTLNTCTTGAQAVGTILFGATGDCTSVTVGSTTYAYNVAPTVSLGQWTYGSSATESATNLAAAINGKTSSPYSATANSDTVHVYANSVGTAGNVTVSKTGGTQPATLANLVGGLDVAIKQWCMRAYTVTANDVDTAVLVNIPLPFAPTKYIPRIMSSAGALKTTVTDLFTIGTTPNRIILTGSGGTHVVAGDVIHLMAQE